MDQVLFKNCTTCTLSKSITDFHKNKKGKFGRNSICKTCIRAKYQNKCPNLSLTPAPVSQRCQSCETIRPNADFYQNPTSRAGIMKICRECYMNRDQSATLSISEYAPLLLHQFQRKYSRKTWNITSVQIAELWNQQRGLCAITGHPMTLEKDAAGNIDNIWNMTLFFKNSDAMRITGSSDILLVCHLIRTMERKYGFNLEKMRNIYQELVGDRPNI